MLAVKHQSWKRHAHNILSMLLFRLDYARAYVEMGWDTKYYGADGPWQAIAVTIGNEQTSLIPCFAGFPAYYGSWLLTPHVCSVTNATSSCGDAGMIEGPSSRQWPEDLTSGNYSWALEGGNTNITISTESPSSHQQQTFHISAMLASRSSITYASGKVLSPEVGLFNFVSPFASYLGDTNCPGSSCDLVGQGASSFSFGLQLGSASLQYAASLIFGGYDKGRAIGPAIVENFTSGTTEVPPAFPLIDIEIGVESGGSPFNVSGYSGLFVLEDEAIPIGPVGTGIASGDPYISLPQPTIDRIVEKLPVYFDSSSKYYLWNTTNGSYEKVVTSASYLGFIFAPSGGQNVTIKVPFMLLNLTLEASASGLATDVAYFPVQYMSTLDPTGSTIIFLGRAFLQAAFWGVHWYGNNVSNGVQWLAQAPGPGGKSKAGLGHEPHSIPLGPHTLDLYTGSNLFNVSWADTWTLLPLVASQKNSTHGSHHKQQQQHHKIANGAIAGIVIGVVLFAALVFGIFFISRRKKRSQLRRSRAKQASDETYEKPELPNEPSGRRELDGSDLQHELPDGKGMHHELPDGGNNALLTELQDGRVASELPTLEISTELPTSNALLTELHDGRMVSELPTLENPLELPTSDAPASLSSESRH